MAQCPDLCTKAKCEELEQRIEQLEQIVEELKQINISGQLNDESLNIEISNNFTTDSTSIDLSDFCTDARLDDHITDEIPIAHNYTPNVSVNLDLIEINDRYYLDLQVNVDNSDGIDTVNWSKTQVDFEQVFVDTTSNNNGQQEIFVAVKINGIVLSDTALISNSSSGIINIDGSYQSDTLTLTVATDTDQDSATILIPLNRSINNLEQTVNNNTININNLNNNITNITNNVNNNTININNLNNNITNITNNVSNNTNNITNITNNMDCDLTPVLNLIEIKTTQLETISNDILDEVTRTIDGEIYTVDCENVNQDGDVEPLVTSSTLSGTSFTGIASLLSETNKQISDVRLALCDIETVETVAIVASDRELTRINGRQLILHFVTENNYPKRQRNSSYRSIQIPSPKNNLNWSSFENIRWEQGNLYAELQLKTTTGIVIKPPVSGFFLNKVSADLFFDSALTLTTLIENNRKYHESDNPQRNITQQTTRIYRAFITNVDRNGNAVCETKFVPPIN